MVRLTNSTGDISDGDYRPAAARDHSRLGPAHAVAGTHTNFGEWPAVLL